MHDVRILCVDVLRVKMEEFIAAIIIDEEDGEDLLVYCVSEENDLMNVEKIKAMRISIPFMIDQKSLENVGYLNYLGGMITVMQVVHGKLNPGLP